MTIDVRAALLEKKKEQHSDLYSEFAGMFGINGEAQAIEAIPIQDTISYAKHPFKVIIDDRLRMLAADIKERGVINPIIVRKIGFENKYEILSGHRRTEASKIAGLTEIKAIIVKATDEQAAQIVVMSNFLQRETILPSERARSYMLRNEYLKKHKKASVQNGESLIDTVGFEPHSHGGNEDIHEILSAEFGESKSNIFRYIRLNYLIEALLELIDARKLKLVVAVDLSYIKHEYQELVYQYFFVEHEQKLEQSMVKRIAEYVSKKPLDEQALDNLIRLDSISKRPKQSLVIKPAALKKYREYFRSDQELTDAVIRFLDDYIQNK